MSDKNFTFNFNGPVGQTIANVEHMEVHMDKDGQIQVMNAEQVGTQAVQPQPQELPAEQPAEDVTEGTFDQHRRLFKEAMIKVQDIPYSEAKYESAIFHSYHWLAALHLGKDLGLLDGYDDFMNLMKGNMKHIPNNQQNLSQYSKYISGDIYPDWKQPDKASGPFFIRFKFIADHIYKLYCVGCQREKIKPRGSDK